ncbi:hypothetical protein ACQ143_07965 [Microbacterium sp. MC2]
MRSDSNRSRRHALTPLTWATGLALAATVVVTGIPGSAPAQADGGAAPTTTAPVMATVAFTASEEEVAQPDSESAQALAAATAALAEAKSTVTEVKAVADKADLDLGDVEIAIDTDELASLTDELRTIQRMSHLFIPHMTDDTVSETTRVTGAIDDLQQALTDAQEKKAAEEAARKAAEAKAKAEREAAEKAAAATERSAAAPSPASGSRQYSGGDARAIARDMLAQRGWGDDQFQCLDALWSRESGWNYQAYNASSGAFGIPQALPGSKMASAGSDWQTNPATQIRWGLGYIDGRYGTPCGAWSHSQSHGWY